jgi:hypothetical protein
METDLYFMLLDVVKRIDALNAKVDGMQKVLDELYPEEGEESQGMEFENGNEVKQEQGAAGNTGSVPRFRARERE